MTQDSKISELKPFQKNVYIKNVEIIEAGEVEEYDMKGKPTKICNGKLRDDTGEISFSAWNETNAKTLSEAKKEGKRIDILNCYCKEYEGKLQLSTGFFGKIKKLE